MATFNANEADNYGSQGGAGFFSLKNDKDTAAIRFMYNGIEDIKGFSVHEVEIDGKKRYVNCLREYNEPVDNCPLCAARYKVIAKLFLQVYDMDTEEVKVWDRGKTFFSKMASLCSRYNPLVSTPFEIERNGKKGDTKTTYETFAMQTDDVILDDLPEVQELLGSLILDKTFEELEFFLDNGYFEEPIGEEAPPAEPQRNPRNDRRPAANTTQGNSGTTRRTPASNPVNTSGATTGRTSGAASNRQTPSNNRPAANGRGTRNSDKF